MSDLTSQKPTNPGRDYPAKVNALIDELMLQLYRACDGRLTLTSGTPVTTADVTGATTIYFTPYKGDRIGLFDGTKWINYAFTEKSIAVPATTNQMYDVFGYDNSGVLALELLAWSSDTVRATALTTLNGVLVKTGATTRRYLGSFRTTGVSGQTEDSLAKRCVYSYYGRVPKPVFVEDGTNTWTYTTATMRQANGNAANQVVVVVGVAEQPVNVEYNTLVTNSGGAGSVDLVVGIGIDSTSTNSANRGPGATPHQSAGNRNPIKAGYVGVLAAGFHYLAALEYSEAAGTTTWYGSNGFRKNNLSGEVWV